MESKEINVENEKDSHVSKIYRAINALNIQVAKLATTLELREQPCKWYEDLAERFREHIEDHKEAKKEIRKTVLQICAAVIASGIIGIIGIIVGMRLKG